MEVSPFQVEHLHVMGQIWGKFSSHEIDDAPLSMNYHYIRNYGF